MAPKYVQEAFLQAVAKFILTQTFFPENNTNTPISYEVGVYAK